jgi:dephospho-CoA kinase
MLIGLTGLYCAGKNFVASLVEEHGYKVLDVDMLAHIALNNQAQAVKDMFGENCITEDGKVNRKVLGGIVFGSNEKVEALESIVHPETNRLTQGWIDHEMEHKHEHLFINAALIHKSCVFDKLDALIIISAPKFVRLMRAHKRDNIKYKSLVKRFKSQEDFSSQYFRNKADKYNIVNHFLGSLGHKRKCLKKRLDEVLDAIGII